MCDNVETPICSPPDGAQFQIGDTIDSKHPTPVYQLRRLTQLNPVTWNPSFFNTTTASTPLQILIQADFLSPSNNDITNGEAGITISSLDAAASQFTWSVLASYLPPNTNSTSAILFLAEPLTTPRAIPTTNGTRFSSGTTRFPGPQIHIFRTLSTTTTATTTINTTNSSSSSSQQQQPTEPQTQLNPLAIALPIAFGALTLLLMAAYILLKRRRPDILERMLPSKLSRPTWLKRNGYGERQSQGQRTGGTVAGGVRLQGKEIKVVTTDLDGLRMNAVRMAEAERGWGGGGGGMGLGLGLGPDGNVFREEVRRQERMRGRV